VTAFPFDRKANVMKQGLPPRVRVLLLLFLVAAARAGAAPPDAAGSWEQEVRAAEQKHRAAFLAQDVAALQAMFSDDFVVNSPLNAVVDKARLLDMVRKGVLAISSFEQNIEQVRRYGDVVVVMGADSVVYAAPSPNAGRTDRRRFTDLWRSEGGRWRFVARQASIICP
jgi:ketosteroid isomerase-like protein